MKWSGSISDPNFVRFPLIYNPVSERFKRVTEGEPEVRPIIHGDLVGGDKDGSNDSRDGEDAVEFLHFAKPFPDFVAFFLLGQHKNL